MSHYYTLIAVDGDELVEKARYTDGKKAAKIASRLSKRTGRKYQVRKIDETLGDPNWKEREQSRFDSGEYNQLCHNLRMIAPAYHYGHIAKKDPNLIAYTKDELKGREDKQSLATIEAYIDICFKHPDVRKLMATMAEDRGLSVEDYIARRHGDDWRAMTIKTQLDLAQQHFVEVKFAGPVKNPDDPDEVKAVADEIATLYANYAPSAASVASSCMRYAADEEHYSAKVDGVRVHPVEAYASPDLAIAYLVDSKGRTTARCLCWPDKKVYGRMYADNDALHKALKALDYVKCDTYYGNSEVSLRGARVRKIDNDRGGYVMPYIDGDHSVSEHHDDNWFTLYGGDYRAESTDGVIYANPQSECENCGDATDDDDMTRVYTYANRSGYEMWCQGCVDHRAFYCNGYDVYYDEQNVDSTEIDGTTYSLRYAENNASYCEYIDGWTFSRIRQVVVDEYGGTQSWGQDSVDEYAVKIGNKYYSTDHLTTVPVVVERYVPTAPNHWVGCPAYTYMTKGLVYYTDRTEDYPDFLIDNGEVDAYTGVDGRLYLRDYVDNYPVTRDRVPEDGEIVESWAHAYVGNQMVWHDYQAGVAEAEAVRLILAEEQRMLEQRVTPAEASEAIHNLLMQVIGE